MTFAARVAFGPTALDLDVQDRAPSAKPDLAAVAGDMQERVKRTLEANKASYATDLSNPAQSLSSTLWSDVQTSKINSQINSAVISAFRIPPQQVALSLEPLQEWEGYVTEVGRESFTARLVDVTARRKLEEEEAEFPISDLSDTDREQLKLGAVFRWVIGYQRSLGGTKRRVSQLTFRRMPAWSKRDLVRAAKKARSFARSITWE